MPTPSKKVYIAPSAFVALIDRANPKYEQASAFFRYFAENEYQLYTDTLSYDKAYQTIKERISPSLAKDFLRALLIGNLNLIYPDESDVKAGVKVLSTYQSNELTFQEALMSVLANRKGISRICTFDYLHPLYGLGVFFLPL